MIELQGKYNSTIVFTDNIEQEAISQIIELLNQEFVQSSQIRIMPDVHKGAGCTIGFTMNIQDKIVPNLVGVDIGCGMYTVKLGDVDLNLEQIDNYIRNNIPSGFSINEVSQTNFKEKIKGLLCFRDIPKSAREYNRALGSLGGGNHFIEINVDSNNIKYLVIHSGSRNLGKQIATYYQQKAFDYHSGQNEEFEEIKKSIIMLCKKEGRRKEIQKAIQELKNSCKKESKIPKGLCYLEGELMNNYLHDMNIAQEYASLNRRIIARRIIEECIGLDYFMLNEFQTIHNYIDMQTKILRKGAISAKEGQKVLIPINMRDGSIIAVGKGNPDWNYSAPHGAGRLMSRSKAKENVSLEEFQESMQGIYTTSVKVSTLDESPMAYKPMEEMINNISDTVDIVDIIEPIYNFKAS